MQQHAVLQRISLKKVIFSFGVWGEDTRQTLRIQLLWEKPEKQPPHGMKGILGKGTRNVLSAAGISALRP